MADAAAPSAAPASPFRSREQMIQQAGKIGLLELSFTKTPEKCTIYAHTAYIIASSGVLRCILEDQDEAPQQQAKKARTDSSAVGLEPIEAADRVIPLDDDQTSAWEAALSMLYPDTMLQAKVTWDDVEGLLLLADKYDMPVIMERVKSFLGSYVECGGGFRQTRLSANMADNNVFNLLKVFSRCGLDDFVKLCIEFIACEDLQLPEGYLTCGLQPKHSEQLYKAIRKHLDTKLSDKAHTIQKLNSVLATTQHKLKREQRKIRKTPKVYGNATCSRCKAPWYWLLDDDSHKVSPICMFCGVMKRTGYLS